MSPSPTRCSWKTWAPRRLPQLDITTSAHGREGTGQINRIPYYDKYARRLRPKLVVLVFITNDFFDNYLLLQAMFFGFDPKHYPFVGGKRKSQ